MMKKTGRIAAYLLFIIILEVSLCWTNFAASTEVNTLKGFEKVADNSSLSMLVNFKNGEFAVINKKSGFTWWSNPPGKDEDKIAKGIWRISMASQLLIQYTDTVQNFTANSFIGSVKKSGMKIKKIKNGVSVTYGFVKEKISIPVRYTIVDDYVKTEIITSEIKEGSDAKLLSIGLLPYFGAGGNGDLGYLMVPDGSGALIHFNNKKYAYGEYSESVYGMDNSLSVLFKKDNAKEIKMPVFGLNNGENGFIAIITKGDGLAKINASVSGKKTSFNNVYSEFEYRSQDTVGLNNMDSKTIDVFKISDIVNKNENFEVRYCLLDGKESGYSSMAKRYQKYLIDECGLKSNLKNTEAPFFLNVFGLITKQKSILGVPVMVKEPLTTYSECIKLVDRLKTYGIDKIILKYDNCVRESGGEISSVFNAENSLGGMNALKRLLSHTEQIGTRFFPNVNFIKYNNTGNGFSVYEDSSKTINNIPSKQYSYKLSTFLRNNDIGPQYLLTPVRVAEAVEKYVKSMKKSGFSSISLDTIGKQIYSDFGKRGINRTKAIEIWNSLMSSIKKSSDTLMVSDANAYVFPYVDYIAEVPVASSSFDIEDESIPFYQMVIHGFIQYSSPSINLSSDPRQMFLKSLETGSCLQYSWIWRDNTLLKESDHDYLYSVNYKAWIASAAKEYREIKSVLAETTDKKIVSHKKLEEYVYETEYEGGKKVIVNYSDKSVEIYGKEVKGQSYIFINK